jgi:ABC-type nitrate/sulfonate/bicarbonate transport system substrate-binding protein
MDMKKILRVLVIIVVVAAGFILLKNNGATDPSSLQAASLRFSWIPSASFAGDIVGITRYANKNGLNLSAEFGGPGINPIQMVIGGADTFGWAGADEVLAANEKGADLVIIGVIHYHPPAGFVSLASKNINTPKDLEGKKVGILPFGNSTMIYETMLKANGVNRGRISEITISSDLKPFLSGAYDVHPVFVYDETVELDRENIEYNLIKPEDFGVKSIKGYVYFTKRTTLQNNPEMVKSFVETMADGWNYAIKNQNSAISMLKDFAPEIDVTREREVLKRAVPYFTAYNKQPLNSDIESWNAMVTDLKAAQVIRNNVDLSKVLQLQFIQEYYN